MAVLMSVVVRPVAHDNEAIASVSKPQNRVFLRSLMTLEDESDGVRITADFSTGSAGPIEQIRRLTYRVDPKPETVPQWFYDALQVNFGGAGGPGSMPSISSFPPTRILQYASSFGLRIRTDPATWIRPTGFLLR